MEVPVPTFVVLTAYSDAGYKEPFERLGVTRFETKPIRFSSLLDILKEFI